MPANLIVPLGNVAYAALLAPTTDPARQALVAAQADALFVFKGAPDYQVEIHGEFRELGTTSLRRQFRDALKPDMRDPEQAIEAYGTPAYKLLTAARRDNARAALAGVAPPLAPGAAPPAPPAHGVTGDMAASEAGRHVLANGGGFVLGYDHKDQPSKNTTTDLINQVGGPGLKHVFVEELSSGLQNEIDAFLADPAAEMPTALRTRIKELQDGPYKADFEPMLYAARDKGVKIWGIDTPEADPQVGTEDPRYHERRVTLMNAEAKRVFDHVQRTYPGEPFMAMTGQMHLNTAEGGIPGLAQIMNVPGFSLDSKANRLAFIPEDTSKRAAVSPLERECVEAILKKAGTDFKAFAAAFTTTPAYTALPTPKPRVETKPNLIEMTVEAQRLVAGFSAAGRLNAPGDIAALVADGAVTAAMQAIFATNVLRGHRKEKAAEAARSGDLAALQTLVTADPYLLKLPVDDAIKDNLLHVAAGAGHATVVADLIGRGMNPNAADLNGRTALHKALGPHPVPAPAVDGLAAATARLLAGGANPNRADPSGATPLDLAKTGPHAGPQVMGAMVAAGAAPATEQFISTFVADLQQYYATVKAPADAAMDTAEMRRAGARLATNLAAAGVPLATPANADAAQRNPAVTTEATRLVALLRARNGRKTEAAAAIKENTGPGLARLQGVLDADPELTRIPLEGDMMALGLAAVTGNDATMADLVGPRGVDVNQKSPKGRTALHEVLSQPVGKTDATRQNTVMLNARRLVLRHGADVNARNGMGETTLHIAGFRNNTAMIGFLGEQVGTARAPDPDARDSRGWTPLDTVMAATNKEAEAKLNTEGLGGTRRPLKAGPLSTVDILCCATLCQDAGDGMKARHFIEKLYANDALRPMLDLAAAAACNDRDADQAGGGLRLFASKTNTVGSLFGGGIGPTAAYDEKVNTLLFPLANDPGQEGDAVGSLAHELTHMTAHLVTNSKDTLPFKDLPATGKADYLAAIDADVRKLALLDDADPVQKFIKDRFGGRMDSYKDKTRSEGGGPKTGAEFDKSLMQEFIVSVPQVAAVYGMDELKKHLPAIATYYTDVWTPMVQDTLQNDARFATGRAKIDAAANTRCVQALKAHPGRKLAKTERKLVTPTDPQLNLDTLMAKVEASYVSTNGAAKPVPAGGRTINYSPDQFELSPAERKDFNGKKAAIRTAIAAGLASDVFPTEINLDEIRALVESVTASAADISGRDLRNSLENRVGNWVKQAKANDVDRRIQEKRTLTPNDLAQAIIYRAEAKVLGDDALDQDTEVKASKQKDAIKKLTETLGSDANAAKLKDPRRLVDSMSAALSLGTNKALYQKKAAKDGHVSMDVKNAKTVWLAELAALP